MTEILGIFRLKLAIKETRRGIVDILLEILNATNAIRYPFVNRTEAP